MDGEKLYVTILAGGMGKRMQSDLPKVLIKVNGEAMIVRLIKRVFPLNPAKILIVVGKFKSIIQEEIEKNIKDDKIIYIDQPIPLGTGDAVKCTLSQFNGTELVTNIILNGDVPLLQTKTINEIYSRFISLGSNFFLFPPE